jgi:hypothetical protein
MLDEKAAHTAHVAIGLNTGAFGGDNEAAIHVDCIFSEPEVKADGRSIELPYSCRATAPRRPPLRRIRVRLPAELARDVQAHVVGIRLPLASMVVSPAAEVLEQQRSPTKARLTSGKRC